ncbi:MAG: MFS transporter [Acidobacteriia bacterium]|nr:MFS transporter [Terriglobia bacterium]
MNSTPPNTKRYELGLVALMFFAWGTVFLDRMSLLYLAPYIAPDLHLTHEQVGMLASALAITWAVSGLVFGALSDRIGRRPVLIPAVFAFSVLSWLSGIARSFGHLLAVRGLMGVAEGPTWSTMTATIEESSAPERRGRNIGIVVSAAALVGMAIAPVMTTQIAAHFGWRGAFFAAGIPGMVMGFLLWKFLREPVRSGEANSHRAKATWKDYFALLRYRNIWLCSLASVGFMTWLFVMHAFAPLYITEVSKQTPTLAGFVMGASGLGAFVWGWLYPWISDTTGRKPMLIFIALLSALVPLTYQVPFLVLHPWLMAAAAFIANGAQAISALALVLVPTESVPARFSATAIGLTTLVGEIFGGTLAPAIAGSVADKHGLSAALWIASGGAIMVFLAALFMRETAPAKRKQALQA